MKNKISAYLQTIRKAAPTVIIIGMLIASFAISSCTEDKTNKAAPTISLTPEATSNVPGATVSTSVQVDSPEGGQLLSILVNGQSDAQLPDVVLDGSASQTIPLNYVIPANAAVGGVYTITLQASDKKSQQSGVAVFAVTVSAIPPKPQVQVPAGNITTNTTWTKDKIYVLNGFVRVGTDQLSGGTPVVSATATLTIEAGTVIYGATGTPGGTLIIHRGSKLIANGTAAEPIVFTSEQAVGQKKSGDWGGVVICGKADINATGSGFVTHTNELEGGYGGYYGGGAAPDAADNSGSLQYVRIEYAGYPINPNQEINGLTLGGVGNGTTVKFIQVTYSNDDSYEWFGGTVYASNLIAYKGIDDDFDTDFGFSGAVQFGLGIRDALIADQSGSNGFESDNDGAGSTNTPKTSAVFSNMTIIGPKATSGLTIGTQFQNGAHLRRNSELKIINSFITAYPTGIFIDGTQGTSTVGNANAGTLILNKNILAGVTNWGGNGFGTATNADENTVTGLPYTPNSNAAAPPRGRIIAAGVIPSGSNPFVNGVFTVTEQQIGAQNALPWFSVGNTILKSYTDAGINSNVFEPLLGAPTLLPTAGSPLLTVAPDFTGVSTAGLNTAISYRGAFGATDWTLNWTNWNPQLTDYNF